VLQAAVAQARYAVSVGLGVRHSPWALDRLIDTLLASREEFGPLDTAALRLERPRPGHVGQRELQERRFRRLVRRAADETAHYPGVLAAAGVDAASADLEDLRRIPLTSRAALHENAEAFVARGSRPALVAATTGPGRPCRVAFSAREIAVMARLATIAFLVRGQIAPGDAVVMVTGPRALATLLVGAATVRIGATARLAGMLDPASVVECLQPQADLVVASPSYLAALVDDVERAPASRPAPSVRRILTGGGFVSNGLRERVQRAFGPVALDETYAATETIPAVGAVCERGHTHFDPAQAVVEVVDPETGAPSEPGAVGLLVVTPLPPCRETTLLLRYDTGDLVQAPEPRPSCALAHLPAIGAVLGRRAASLRLPDGEWITPRRLRDAVERLDRVPLPARYALERSGDGVRVELVVRDAWSTAIRGAVSSALDDASIPVGDLRLVGDRRQLSRRPLIRSDG
jgi:phenylacetate-coenzyme A ligase PaaK-like adenylate-forming protein